MASNRRFFDLDQRGGARSRRSGETTLETSGKERETTLETSGKESETTLAMSGKDAETLETSGEDHLQVDWLNPSQLQIEKAHVDGQAT